MRLEQVPIILGILVVLIGLTMALDAWQTGGAGPFRERRRRTRAVPHKAGQTFVAIGTICLGIALIGRDTWRYTTITVLIGVVLLVAGAIMNRVYLKEVLFFRGAARRGQGKDNTRVEKKPAKDTHSVADSRGQQRFARVQDLSAATTLARGSVSVNLLPSPGKLSA